MRIDIPENIREIMRGLTAGGYEAYLVGGCVRDSIMGAPPSDYDVTTSALPEQVKAALPTMKIIETGIKHGTVTVINHGTHVEVTTYRIDGEYSDSRRPDSVRFTAKLAEDLKRRDFTMNALAYNDENGLVDLFGGADDIADGIIRCVGAPEKRFSEDALRIMRALRFSACLGFTIEAETAAAIHNKKTLLSEISGERVSVELNKMLDGDCEKLLTEYRDVIAVFIPELAAEFDFEQRSKYHCYDVYTHTCVAVGSIPCEEYLRLTMLLHDIGKPQAYSFYDNHGHFRGHEGIGSELARTILHRLKYDGDTIDAVCSLIKYHDVQIRADRHLIMRQLRKYSEDCFFRLIAVHIADDMAKAPEYRDRIPTYEQARAIAKEILAEQACFSLKKLAVNGRDMIALGFAGSEIGGVLDFLLDMVVDEKCANDKQALLEQAGKYRQK